jgi:hypothetical protein
VIAVTTRVQIGKRAGGAGLRKSSNVRGNVLLHVHIASGAICHENEMEQAEDEDSQEYASDTLAAYLLNPTPADELEARKIKYHRSSLAYTVRGRSISLDLHVCPGSSEDDWRPSAELKPHCPAAMSALKMIITH